MGTAIGLNSSSQCIGCPPGHYCLEGRRGSSPEPIPCSKGFYNIESGQAHMGACKSCPESANSVEGSATIAACKCNHGYYDSELESDAVDCKMCKIGSACNESGTTLESLPLLKCHYRTSSKSNDLRRCPDCDHDSGCIGGVGDEGPCKPCAASATVPCAAAPPKSCVCACVCVCATQVAHRPVLPAMQRQRRLALLRLRGERVLGLRRQRSRAAAARLWGSPGTHHCCAVFCPLPAAPPRAFANQTGPLARTAL